ncbi:MAG TPA: MFS transporter [Chitinophagaceae bacterium]|nr:MFS transporter [Chitinophagaceae bacterium]
MNNKQTNIFCIPVLVGALGYFVDIYDLLLFSIIRVPSLKSMGLTDELIKTEGMRIINIQMLGLLIGGIIWGVLGDKKGRLKVLFGSILLYSLANIANGFVTNATQYAWLRFITGIGLAGELGASITLVSEILSKEKRGIGTSLVAGIGLSGAVAAYFVSRYFDWHTCYFIGGGLGLALLLLRVSVYESHMFEQVSTKKISRGNFFLFFTNAKRFKKYLLSILIGLPNWYVIGILITFSKEFGAAFHIKEPVNAGKAVMYAYVGISIGDIATGLISQWLRSRKKVLYIFYALTAVSIFLYFQQQQGDANNMYWICALLGFSTGFWAILVTMAAEQFGTNLRATAATTVPNMVRGSLNLITLLFVSLQTAFDYIESAWVTGIVIMIIAIVSAIYTQETFGKDLDYIEED